MAFDIRPDGRFMYAQDGTPAYVKHNGAWVPVTVNVTINTSTSSLTPSTGAAAPMATTTTSAVYVTPLEPPQFLKDKGFTVKGGTIYNTHGEMRYQWNVDTGVWTPFSGVRQMTEFIPNEQLPYSMQNPKVGRPPEEEETHAPVSHPCPTEVPHWGGYVVEPILFNDRGKPCYMWNYSTALWDPYDEERLKTDPRYTPASSSSSSSTKKGPRPMRADPTEKLKSRLNRLGYLTSDRKLLQQVYLLTQDTAQAKKGGRIPAIICDGPPGTGKTELAKAFAKMWRATSFLRLQLVRGVGIDRLMYDLDIPAIIRAQAVGSSDFRVIDALKPGILWKALERSKTERVVLLLDELDKAQEYVDSFLLEFLNDCVISDPADAGNVIHGNPANLVVFLTKNKERPLSEPLMRRCRRVYFSWPEKETEMRLVKKLALAQVQGMEGVHTNSIDLDRLVSQVIDSANNLRKMEQKMLKVPSTPELSLAVADMLQLPKDHWGDLLHAWLFAYNSDAKDIGREHSEFRPSHLQTTVAVAARAK